MSNAWGTPSEHSADVRRQVARERGETPPAETKPEESTETPKVEAPTVILPDGTQVAVDQYDPYQQQRTELEAQRNQNEGILSFLKSQGIGTSEDASSTPEEPETPSFTPIAFSEDEMIDAPVQQIAGHINEFAGMTHEQIASIAKGQQKLTDDLGKLVKTLNTRYLEDDLAKVSARTGFSRDVLIAANSETGIDDPEMVATYLSGKAAQEEAAKKKAEEADAERKRQAAGITGTTGSGTGTGTGAPGADERQRIDYTKAEEVAKHFKFGAV